YTIEIIDEMNRSDFIDHVVALNSLSELEEVITATKNADILTTSVGAINLVKIAPIIAQALSKRFEQKHSINIVANENVINASDVLKKEIYSLLSEKEQENFDEYAYFVNTAIDRQSLGKVLGGKMISVVEPYYEWIMDRQQLDPTTS
ncbi:mannitol-1-phosphate 5-dehydrogenase, partial [Enterococcus faecium]|nr:mannitol-1-phosphate 5-dehydrogenase [Enterococcus faecium]